MCSKKDLTSNTYLGILKCVFKMEVKVVSRIIKENIYFQKLHYINEFFNSNLDLRTTFFKLLNTVTAPLTAAVTSQELLFWGLDYHIKNA